MSLKVCIDEVGRQSVTVEKDGKKSKGGRHSRVPVDLRAVISSKERSGREEQRESRDKERASVDLRDRLEKNRVQIDFEDFEPIMKAENCDISESGKKKIIVNVFRRK